jgi:hypothetical protein
VLDRDETVGTATSVVLNRPMAMKLTENLAQLVKYGAYVANDAEARRSSQKDMVKFMMAFGSECAVYVGGPDKQDEPAIMIHGFRDLPGATEVSPGAGIYRGGLDAAIEGVIDGKYKSLDFRFFVGRHRYTNSHLDVEVILGKYQPVACARALALKQCISLPKPLWHEGTSTYYLCHWNGFWGLFSRSEFVFCLASARNVWWRARRDLEFGNAQTRRHAV